VTRILAVDDEPQILRALATNLRARGYTVDLAGTGEAALTLAARKHPDLVILDLGLPGMDGVEVIRGLRGWSAVPIIVLSVRDAERDKVAALDAGADDYVTKPFGMDELLARLRAALRRSAPGEDEAVVETEHFMVDLAAKRVTTPAGEVRLTPTEWHVVEVLVRNAGKLVTQRQLLQEVWGPQYGTETNYLRVYLAQIRAKLEPEPSRPRYFLTEARMGYRFESRATSPSKREPLGAGARCGRSVRRSRRPPTPSPAAHHRGGDHARYSRRPLPSRTDRADEPRPGGRVPSSPATERRRRATTRQRSSGWSRSPRPTSRCTRSTTRAPNSGRRSVGSLLPLGSTFSESLPCCARA